VGREEVEWLSKRVGTYLLKCRSEKMPEQSYSQGKKQAKQNHGSDGKVKAEVFPFYSDIAGQVAYPVEFITKKINNKPGNNNNSTQ